MFIDPYRWQTVRILTVIHESPDAVTLVTERPDNYVFQPGQHAIVRVTLEDKTTRLRQYSFAHTPSMSNLHFTITRSPDGEVSGWCIDRASTKSTIDISQAFTGPLFVDLTSYKRIGMIGGGSGIVPLMAHMRQLRQNNSSQKATLLYSTRSSSRCYKDELQSANEHEQIVRRITDSEPRFNENEITEAMQDCDIILLCGSRQFVTQMQTIIHRQFPQTTILAEAFSLQ